MKDTLYMLTISCNQKLIHISKKDIYQVIMWLKYNIDSLQFIQVHYEYGTIYNQLHLHSIVSVNEDFRWKPYTLYGDVNHLNKTYHIDWRRVFNTSGAIKYIQKDTNKTDSIIQYYQTHYFNQDTQRFSVTRI